MKKAFGYFFYADNIVSRCVCAFIYAMVYDYTFKEFVYKLFYYMDIDYIDMGLGKLTAWIILSIIPIVFYKGLKRVSSFLTIFLYVFVYIPFIHTLFIMWNISIFNLVSCGLCMCMLFSLYFSIGEENTFLKNIIINPLIPFKWLELITFALTFILVATNFSSMHFVNIFTQADLMYQLREENSEGGTSIAAYIKGWMFGGFYPFLLVNYLGEKKWVKVFITIGAYFILFMMDMQKLTFFMPFALILLYFLIKREKDAISQRLHAFLMYFFSIVSVIILCLKNEVLQLAIGFIVILRTSAVAGWLSQYYLRFFFVNDNPFTYYSHINIVNIVTQGYPYSQPLGKVVAYGTQNANANFFLTDGVAAAGLAGMLFIGIVFYLLLHFINSISYRYKITDLLIIFMPSLSYILNTSLFTTLLSNGLLILILMTAGADCPIDIYRKEKYENEQ